MEAALAVAPPDAPAAARARALLGAGALSLTTYEATSPDTRVSEARLAEALELFRILNDQAGIVPALCFQGFTVWHNNDTARAQVLYEQSLAVARQTGRYALIGWPLEHLASLAIWQEDWTRATAWCEDFLAAGRKAENGQDVAVALVRLGLIAQRRLDFTRAIALTEQGLQAARTVGYRRVETQALMQIGESARYLGDLARSRAAFEELYTSGLMRDDEFNAGFGLQLLGKVACDAGEYANARNLFTRSLAMRQKLGEWSIPYNLEGLAGVDCAEGYAVRAARLLGAAEAIRAAIHWPLWSDNIPEYEQLLAAIRKQLNPESFATAWAEGQAMTVEQAVACALDASDVRLLKEV